VSHYPYSIADDLTVAQLADLEGTVVPMGTDGPLPPRTLRYSTPLNRTMVTSINLIGSRSKFAAECAALAWGFDVAGGEMSALTRRSFWGVAVPHMQMVKTASGVRGGADCVLLSAGLAVYRARKWSEGCALI
jgi:hypothetical protein